MIRANKRRFTIATYLLSGFLPWGVDFRRRGDCPTIGRYPQKGGRNWPLCCGHVMTDAEVEQWLADGLAIEAEPGPRGERRISAGPNLERWVSYAWHGLTVASWGPTTAIGDHHAGRRRAGRGGRSPGPR